MMECRTGVGEQENVQPECRDDAAGVCGHGRKSTRGCIRALGRRGLFGQRCTLFEHIVHSASSRRTGASERLCCRRPTMRMYLHAARCTRFANLAYRQRHLESMLRQSLVGDSSSKTVPQYEVTKWACQRGQSGRYREDRVGAGLSMPDDQQYRNTDIPMIPRGRHPLLVTSGSRPPSRQACECSSAAHALRCGRQKCKY
ncbi:hypothetical protein OH76DRAFT_1231315 [Lentinus brumalis]|uniref:Uncharacterized protein n=1 Tax=Lentinus brumalis TaxID=2498619 RepID=A0A371CSE1_9APHY|nr:hypothetical protein OH76DRAFT_1231315 [Polyporus brumalis]